jgi:hypothetical protein
MPTKETLNLLKRSVDAAARNRLNTLSFTVSWPADLTPFVTYKALPKLYDHTRAEEVERNVKILREVVVYAKEWGLDTYMTITEFTYPKKLVEAYPEVLGQLPPERQRGYLKDALCPSSPLTWQFYEAKLGEFLERIPEIAGFDLWVAESDSDVFACQCRRCMDYLPYMRILDLVKKTYEISRRDGNKRKLIFRSFLSGFRTCLYNEEWLSYLAKELPPDIIVRHREEPIDFLLGNPPTFLMGKFGDRLEVIDLDAYGEYRGGVLGLPSCIPEHFQSRMKSALRLGVKGVGIGAGYGLNEVNLQAFYKLAWNVDYPLESIWREWAVGRFGEEAADKIIELAKLSDEVILKSFYVNGLNVNAHYYVFPQSIQRWRYLMIDFSAKFMRDGYERARPTFENLEKIVAEKEEAIELCKKMIDILEEVKPNLKQEDYASLKKTLELELEVVKTWRWLAEAVFRYLIFETTLSEVDREMMRDEIVAAVESCRLQIEKLKQVMSNLNRFVKNYPIINAITTCDQIIERISYPTALVSGYHPLSYYKPKKFYEP